jgi:predicted phosphate transport protein (TIGR00153 family)
MKIDSIFQVFVPKDRKFFPLFEKSAENIVKSAILLNKMLLIEDINQRNAIIDEIKEVEKAGDEITHTIFDELNHTFITPFDREDIHRLTATMDDVLDLINSSAQQIKLYKIDKIPGEFVQMSELILQGAREIKNAVCDLRNLKKASQIKKACIRINEIENLADDVYNFSISDLFENEKDAIKLIKIRDILASLESATDFAEDVSDVLKTIIVKQA